MFVYSLADGLPDGSRTVWSRQPLQPLTGGPLTPFSYSVLEEVARRAWYQYYDELGFAPQPRAHILRQHNGCAYLNLTLSARLDAEQAGLEPLTIQLNGESFGVAKWEAAGFLAGIKQGRRRRKIATTLAAYGDAIPAITQKAAGWSAKTRELRWTQADVLQVMEEIERVGVDSFKLYFAARHNLEWAYNRLLWLTNDQQPYPANVALLNSALRDLTELTEYKIAKQFTELGTMAAESEAAMAWLATGKYENWTTTLPDKSLVRAIQLFLNNYGHRCVHEAEIENPRWATDEQLLFVSLRAHANERPEKPSPLPTGQQMQRLLAAVAPGEQKHAQQLLDQTRQLMQLQSQALQAFAHLLAGTRRWAFAAAGEAMADERITAADDVFYFTLEEVKQMMTGEWNISAQQEIQQTCATRRAEFANWQSQAATEGMPWLMVGDRAADHSTMGIPAAGGEAIGPLRHWNRATPTRCAGAIVGAEHVDAGWSLIMPLVRALLIAQGTPLEPLIAAARAWHIPTVTTLDGEFQQLVEGAQTTVNGNRGHVEQ